MSIKGLKKNRLAISLLLILILLLCAGVSTLSFFYDYLGKFSKNSKENVPLAKVTDKNSPINILILGVDIGDVNSKDNDNIKRTDSIMVANYNPSIPELKLISIPRDTLIQVNGKNNKINAAYALGGIKYAVASVEGILGIDINYYAKLDYEGFRRVIDAIGGVDMEITQNMNYDDDAQNLHIRFKKGEVVHLDGKKAEEFFRWRKNNDGTGLADGDLGRIENQHKLISKVIEKFKSVTIIPKINNILNIIPEYVSTNMLGEDILKYGLSFIKIDKANIAMHTIKGDAKYINGISYLIYNEKNNRELLASIQHTSQTFKNISKGSLKVKILNGTKTNGLASNISKKAEALGYKNISIGNTDKVEKSRILVKPYSDEMKAQLERDFNIHNIETLKENNEDFDAIVYIGEDFKSN